MWWILFRYIPLKGILQLLLIIAAVTGAVVYFGAVDVAAQESGLDDNTQLPFEHSENVTWESVEITEDGYAVLTISSDGRGEDIVITDISRSGTGEVHKYYRTLDEGTNTLRVPLVEPDNAGVSVDLEDGRMFQWVDSTSLNWLPDKGHAVPLAIGGGVLLLVIMLGLHLLHTRGEQSAENALS
jgi:hypothetical protein